MILLYKICMEFLKYRKYMIVYFYQLSFLSYYFIYLFYKRLSANLI